MGTGFGLPSSEWINAFYEFASHVDRASEPLIRNDFVERLHRRVDLALPVVVGRRHKGIEHDA